MTSLDVQTVRKMLEVASETIIANEKYLCELDSVIGDGDHGVTAARGFRKVLDILHQEQFTTIQSLMVKVGASLTSGMGGAIGPIFGTIFSEAGKHAGEKSTISAQDWHDMFEASLQKVMRIGRVQEGDRTIVDALAPAVRSMKNAINQGKSLKEIFHAAAEAAEEGAENTKKMMAKKGRARFLGEKSMGYRDAGASSIALIFKSMYECVADK